MATSKKPPRKRAPKAAARPARGDKAASSKKPTARARTSRTRPVAREASPSRARVAAILRLLAETYPAARTALAYQTPLQLLVATILSAQCTDERVNRVTPVLFQRFPDAAALARAPTDELEEIIHPTGFFRNKARSIQGACRLLAEKHGGEVPQTMEAMLELPGVARKTANVVLGSAFGLITGIVVDTHVRRVSARLGLTREEDPEKIERELMELLPRERWIDFSHELILHGRALCVARKPRCESCPLAPHCPSAGTVE